MPCMCIKFPVSVISIRVKIDNLTRNFGIHGDIKIFLKFKKINFLGKKDRISILGFLEKKLLIKTSSLHKFLKVHKILIIYTSYEK